jgi:hypothetical protein
VTAVGQALRPSAITCSTSSSTSSLCDLTPPCAAAAPPPQHTLPCPAAPHPPLYCCPPPSTVLLLPHTPHCTAGPLMSPLRSPSAASRPTWPLEVSA